MKIQDKSLVVIEYTLSLDSGEEVFRSEPGDPQRFIFNAGQMIPGLERQLAGMEANQSVQFTVDAEEGYGQPRPELYREIARDALPRHLEVKPGMTVQSVSPHGTIPFRVKSVEGDKVTIDLNHPLCGQRLHFDVKVVEVRQASEEELAALACDDDCNSRSCEGCGGE